MLPTAHLLRFTCTGAALSAQVPTDAELLHRYEAGRNEEAFAELVRRNGPMVLRTCRHALGEAAADDAFQATFLLLARSAPRLPHAGSLAGWLHATAVRVAHNARRGELRRRRREATAPVRPARAGDELSWREVRELVDTEIAALPEKYRAPLVLCYVRELSYDEAAHQTGCPVGALRGRLERGKELLRKRLAKYGLPLAPPVLALGPPNPVSAALAEATLKTVRALATGDNVPVVIAGLVRSRRLRVAVLAPIVIALATIGAVLAGGGASADPPSAGAPLETVA